MKRVVGCFVCGVLVLLLTGADAWAQAGATAQISGTVRDASGGVLPGVDVAVTQTETGLKRNATSDAAGSYVLPNLPPGPYRLDAMLQGFRTYTQTGIVLEVGASPVINLAMALGQVAETVTVTGATPVVETRNLGVGQVMDNKRILELPLNGRNSADLIAVLPAAVPQPALNATSRSMGGSSGGIAYSLAGGVTFGISYVLDGATHNNPYDNLNLPLPFPDALGEFKAETSALTAQNGMHSGAAVNAITKSGTNVFHGDGFEFFRHHSLNALDPFAAKDAAGNRKDDGLKRNQFGGTLGGPLLKDRLFFFAGYQGTYTRQLPTDNRATVPTAAMLAGDFTAFAAPACNGGVPRTFVPGNKVLASTLSPAALSISAKLPLATDPCGIVNYGLPFARDEGQTVGKVDYQVSNKHRVFGRYIATKQFEPPPFSLPDAQQNLLVTSRGGRDNLAQTFATGDDFVISPTTLNAFRFAFNRTAISRTSTDFFSAPEVGINIYSYMPHYMLLTVSPNGFQLGGGTESLSTFVTNEWQVGDDLTLVRGSHQLAFGGNLSGWKSLSLANVRSPGQLSIDATGAPTGVGSALVNFLLGRLPGNNSLIQAAPNTLDMKQVYLGLYAQDTWRVSSKLTINYGLRWEPFFPQQLQNGAVYQFDQARFNQNIHSTVFVNAPAGLYFPGDPGFPSKAGMLTQWDNLGPRVGVAWDPNGDGKTSIRASYGRSFEFVNAQFHLNTSVAPPWGSEIRLNATPGGLDNPFLGSGQSNIFPLPPELTSTTPFSINGPYLSLSNDMKATNVHLWNVTFERQFAPQWFASIGYVGSRTNNLWESTPLNNALPVTVNGQAPSPLNTNARRPLTLQDPTNGKYYQALDLYVTDGTQRYNGMIVTVRRTAARASFAANYTLSHCYGSPDGFGASTTNVSSGYNIPSNPGYDDGNCTADRLHNFTASASVETPRFERRSLRMAASGWRLAGSFRAITGPWLTVTTGLDQALNGQAGTQRVNQVNGNTYADGSTNPANGFIRWLDPNAFAQPTPGTFGNMARNSVRGPYNKNVDLALTRAFPMGRQGIEVRAEAFNAFNWLELNPPAPLNLSFSSATFGQINSAFPPRIIQLAVKYTF